MVEHNGGVRACDIMRAKIRSRVDAIRIWKVNNRDISKVSNV